MERGGAPAGVGGGEAHFGEGPSVWEGRGESGGVWNGEKSIEEAADEEEEILWGCFGGMRRVLEGCETVPARVFLRNWSAKTFASELIFKLD